MKFSANYLKEVLDLSNLVSLKLEIESDVKLRKEGNPFLENKVCRNTIYELRLNTNYESEVSSRRKEEGKESKFEIGRSWHKPLYTGRHGALVVRATDTSEDPKTYLSCIINSSIGNGYFVDGNIATKEQIELIKKFEIRSNRSNSKNQELEVPVIFRIFDLKNIVSVSIRENV